MHYNQFNYSKYSDSQDDSSNFDSDSSRNTFDFSKAYRMTKSAGNTSCSGSYQSDSSLSDTKIIKMKQRHKKKLNKQLPPIGVFWDIENCHVPKNISAAAVVKKIREFFFDGYREAEFMIVCDVKKESSIVIQDLHDAQVNLIHVCSISKNAADEKLRQSLRRFAEIYPPPSAIVLITSDVNFASDLSDLRYRKKIHVILVHNNNVADALMLCANETYNFSVITENLPCVTPKSPINVELCLLISNLPINFNKGRIKSRLKLLSSNCGGKVISVNNKEGTAMIRFTSSDFLTRAQKRLKGEDVYGHKINVTNLSSSCKSVTGKKMKNSEFFHSSHSTASNFPALDTGNGFGESKTMKNDWVLSSTYQGTSNTPMNSQDLNMIRAIKGSGNMLSKSNEQLWKTKRDSFSERRSRTPQEHSMGAGAIMKQQISPFSNDEDYDIMYDQDYSSMSYKYSTANFDGIELLITNLDASIKANELKKTLIELVEEIVMIISLNIITQMDGSLVASVKVASQMDAQHVILQLQHYKLGYKRINVSYSHNSTLATGQLKDMVIALLQEVPGKRMPLFKLLELLEIRFHINVPCSEVIKLKDISKITEERAGRVIHLMPDVRTSPNSSSNISMLLYCSLHCPNVSENKGWGELETSQLPNIIMPFKLFVQQLNKLLNSHMGTLSLLSLPICYEYEFGVSLPINEAGVPLEHLITCVDNVELKCGGPNKNIKYITRKIIDKQLDSERIDGLPKGCSPTIASNIQSFCRETVDLLKTTFRCQLLFRRFIPAYHHHFGRQCRVADYGYTKLIDLLESPVVSNYIQILGDGSRRTITLTHTTQMRRFTSDLFRILKNQVSKQMLLTEIPVLYERIFSKQFNSIEYGMCSLEDLLEDLPENTIIIKHNLYPAVISIPKKEQTAEEILRTKQFADEVVKLLCHSPQYSMLFNKFVPAYHHHFGYQCRVSDFGFSKLIELFEAIPDTVKIEELTDGERLVRLTQFRALQVLGSQLVELIKQHQLGSVSVETLCSSYLREYGYSLKPQTYGYDTLEELVSQLQNHVKIINTTAGPLLILADNEVQSFTIIRIWSLLIESPHYLSLTDFCDMYYVKYQNKISKFKLEEFSNVVKISNQKDELMIQLTYFYIMAAQIYKIIFNTGGQIAYNNLERKYLNTYGRKLNYSECGTNSLLELLNSLNFMIVIKGNYKKLTLSLNEKLLEYGIGLSLNGGQKSSEKNNELHWPPPPIHDIAHSNVSNKITPPKPDTPPANDSWPTWTSPSAFESSINFHIDLPSVGTPKLLGSPGMLTSPTSIFGMGMHMRSTAPDPTELPMPDKLLGKGIIKDDSNDSGVMNNSNITLENEMDLSNDKAGAKPKMQPNYNNAYLTYRL